MRRILPILLIVCVLAVPGFAGEVNVPGVIPIPPPPCEVNCTSSTTTSTPLATSLLLVLVTAIG